MINKLINTITAIKTGTEVNVNGFEGIITRIEVVYENIYYEITRVNEDGLSTIYVHSSFIEEHTQLKIQLSSI